VAAGLVAIASIISACGSGSVTNEAGLGQDVTVTVSPDGTTVAAGGTQVFTASVTGTANTAVTWAVQEGAAGGAIAAGNYTAPAGAGTFHVVATSVADPTRSGSAAITVTAPAPVVSVTVAPLTATLAAGAQRTFTATVTGATDTVVTWSVVEAACGTITAAGVYTAPATGATCRVRATSRADSTRSATATVTVTPPAPVSVSVTPLTGTVNGCQTLALTATVTGGTGSRAVTWSIQEGAGNGTVSSTGVYTAPDGEGSVHVVATSVADPTKTAVATLTVATKVLSVAVNPATVSVPASGTAQFAATVTTTCGSTVALKLVDAAGHITSAN
jgi:uncharacterized protein YjdB